MSLKRPPDFSEGADTSTGECSMAKQSRSEENVSENGRKVFIGSLPPSITEKPLVAHFRAFGHVVNCNVVRDRENGISKGFAFLTFLDESEAEAAINFDDHKLDGKPIKVSYVRKFDERGPAKKNHANYDTISLPQNTTKVFVGPIDPDMSFNDVLTQLSQYGPLRTDGVMQLVTPKNRGMCCADYRENVSIRRAFTNKTFIKGRLVKVTMSRLAMELLLSNTVVFFHEAHNPMSKLCLFDHFGQFGAVFRAFHFAHEDRPDDFHTYGFVDFVGEDAVERAIEKRQQLVNDQYIRVGRILPGNIMNDLRSITDRYANMVIRKLDALPDQGVWGPDVRAKETAKVRIPAKMVGRLIGDRGKTITNICRDSKTKISIPKVDTGPGADEKVILTITGTKPDIRMAQYLMQKLLKQ